MRLERPVLIACFGLAAALTFGAASAQPAAPSHAASAAPTAAPVASARPVASAAAVGSSAPLASSSAAASSAPAAAPPSMPPGHGTNPHGGAAHGARRERFEAPEDGSEEAQDLPPGTILLMVADRDELPVPGAPVRISIVHSSIAKGDSHEQLDRVTDVAGMVKLDGLEMGSANAYRISVKVGEAAFALPAIQLGEKAGKRALLHVYDAAEDLAAVEAKGPFGSESEIRTSVREDVLTVRHRCRLYNLSPVAWLADVEIPLPKGFKAFQTPDEAASSPVQILQTEHGAVLRGTVPPGTTELVFGYHVPLSGDSDQSIELSMFPNTVGVGIVAEASKKMSLTADGFSQPQFTRDEQGLSVLVAGRQGTPDAPVSHFRVTLNGLPTRGMGGYIAALLAVIALATAGAYRIARSGRKELEPETVRDLVEARETLIREIAALETAHAKGIVGPKTYERSRELLLDALARILAKIEGPLPAPPVEASDAE